MPRELSHFVSVKPSDQRSPRLEVRYYLPDEALDPASGHLPAPSTPSATPNDPADNIPVAPIQPHQVVILVTHPYGPMGGNMENNVVFAVCEEFARRGYRTARYNMRGVGKSTGSTSWSGANELDDCRAIIEWLAEKDPKPKKVVIIGYSYGSMISCPAIENSLVAGAAAVSYPFGVSWFLSMFGSEKFLDPFRRSEKPKLLVIGDSDSFTGVGNFKSKASGFAQPTKTQIYKGVDHFWWGAEPELASDLANWVDEILGVKPATS